MESVPFGRAVKRLLRRFRPISMTKQTGDADSTVVDHKGTVDLTPYAARIIADEDRPLFRDAVVAGKAGALRAAYVMIWLACAESLKRRFRTAAKRDSDAGQRAGNIARREEGHQSVDRFVLDQAKEYGFLSDSVYTELGHVYEMRCLYAHPYEEEPSTEQVTQAAAAVVSQVLSRPVKLRHNYGERLLVSLTSDRNYLDDHPPAVEAFARDTIARLDDTVQGWFLRKYWNALETVADDPSMGLFTRRGEWFSSEFLGGARAEHLFSSEEWHGLMAEVPKTLAMACSKPPIFGQIGERAQDSLVGVVLDEAATRPSVLTRLEVLAEAKALSLQQGKRFAEHVLSLDVDALRATRLKLTTCFRRVISALRERNWYVQNPAVALVESWGPEHVAQLSEREQDELGRNILQAAHGNSNAARRFLVGLSTSADSWPIGLVRGALLECLINERMEIRFKDKHLTLVLDAIPGLSSESRESVIEDVTSAIQEGVPEDWCYREDFQRVSDAVRGHCAGREIARCLDEKAKTVVERPNIDLSELLGLS